MTVDSAYFIDRQQGVGLTEFSFSTESIGADAMRIVYLQISDGARFIRLPETYTLEFEQIRNPIMLRGKVTLNEPLLEGFDLQFERYTPRLNELVVENTNQFPSKAVENQLDKITYMLQELEGSLCDCSGDYILTNPPITNPPVGGTCIPPTFPTPIFPSSVHIRTYDQEINMSIDPAEGTEPITYQWYINGAPQAGQTGLTAQFNIKNGNDIGEFSVVATNACGAVASAADVSRSETFECDSFNTYALSIAGLSLQDPTGANGEWYEIPPYEPLGGGSGLLIANEGYIGNGYTRIYETNATNKDAIIDYCGTIFPYSQQAPDTENGAIGFDTRREPEDGGLNPNSGVTRGAGVGWLADSNGVVPNNSHLAAIGLEWSYPLAPFGTDHIGGGVSFDVFDLRTGLYDDWMAAGHGPIVGNYYWSVRIAWSVAGPTNTTGAVTSGVINDAFRFAQRVASLKGEPVFSYAGIRESMGAVQVSWALGGGADYLDQENRYPPVSGGVSISGLGDIPYDASDTPWGSMGVGKPGLFGSPFTTPADIAILDGITELIYRIQSNKDDT